jgi:hypothetical protein
MRRRTFLRSAAASAAVLALPTPPSFTFSERGSRRRLRSVEAVTGDGRTVTLSDGMLDELRSAIRGRMLLAEDDGYEEARRILNPSFDRRPALVVQPTGVADVRTAIDFAQGHGGLLLAVKCGGHSFSGQSTCDRGMVLDLSLFRDVRVDPEARRAWVTGGSLLGAVDHEAMAHGLVTPLGTVSHTGVGGLVTGGGFGRVARQHGLSVDNLESVQVVTADGQLRRASAEENPDLFWGVRGGGGNFGVVTSFEFRLHPMSRTVYAGALRFPVERTGDALRVFGEYGPEAPDTLDMSVSFEHLPGEDRGIVAVSVCYSGEPSRLESALAPIRALGRPVSDSVGPMDYTVLQRSGDVLEPRAQGVYLKAGFIPGLGGDLQSAIVDGFPGHPSRYTALFFQQGGGAISRVAPEATAFSQRDIFANMIAVSGWRHGVDDPAPHMQAIRDYWSGLEPFTHGFYVNDVEADHTQAAVRENYRSNHERLVAVKNRYDPTNLFRLNANVAPTVTAGG